MPDVLAYSYDPDTHAGRRVLNLVFRLGVPQVNAYMYGTKFSTRVDAGVVGCTYIYFGVGHSRTHYCGLDRER